SDHMHLLAQVRVMSSRDFVNLYTVAAPAQRGIQGTPFFGRDQRNDPVVGSAPIPADGQIIGPELSGGHGRRVLTGDCGLSICNLLRVSPQLSEARQATAPQSADHIVEPSGAAQPAKFPEVLRNPLTASPPCSEKRRQVVAHIMPHASG